MTYNPLIIKYDQCRKAGDLPQILHDLKKFLITHGLEDKTLISVGMPQNEEELETIRKLKIEPDKVIVLHESSRRHCQDRYLTVLKNYYRDRTVDIHGGFPMCPQKNMKMLCERTKKCLTYTERKFFLPAIWFPRIVLIGAIGSGTRSQAALLANQFNLVFVDADDIVNQWCKTYGSTAAVYDIEYLRSSVLYERLMQPDCLRQGYVLIKFPYTVREFKYLISAITRPNK